MRNGQFIYEGCDLILLDGKACALGKVARQNRAANFNTEQDNSRSRAGHTCKPIGEGKPMYIFMIQIGNVVMNVWEQAGKQLLGLIGQQFHEVYTTKIQRIEGSMPENNVE